MNARRLIPAGAAIALAAFGLSPAVARAQAPSCSGAKYVEMPDGGPRMNAGRPLSVQADLDYGIDINTTLQLQLDTLCVLARLDQRSGNAATRDQRLALGHRLDSLTAVTGRVATAVTLLGEAFAAYTSPSPDVRRTFPDRLRASSGTIQDILRTLQWGIQARLESGGLATADASRRSKQEIAPVFVAAGYDWEALRLLLDREIRLAAGELDTLRRAEAYKLEVRAHLVTDRGAFPLAVTGYNAEQRCAEARVEPIQLAPSPAQVALYHQADALAAQIGATRSVGDVVLAQVSADLERVRPQADSVLTRAERATAPVIGAGRDLLRWADRATLQAWLGHFAGQLANDPNGPAAEASLDSLATEIGGVDADLAAVRSLLELRADLRGASALTTMQALLDRVALLRRVTSPESALRPLRPDTWQDRANRSATLTARIGTLGATLRDRLRNDPNGPLKDFERLHSALLGAADSLQGISADALGAISRLLGLPPAVIASELPEPAGLMRRDIGQGLDASIPLKNVCAERRENDVVQIEYRFFRGDSVVRGAGWTDRFRLRVYGWSSRFAAGVAFALREHTDVWQPGAAVSWIFSHAGWPEAGERGVGDPLGLGRVGLGLTAVNLHFDGAEAIQVGLGPSLSLFGDRVIVGGGWNLQSHGDHLYGLLSIRLLDLARGT